MNLSLWALACAQIGSASGATESDAIARSLQRPALEKLFRSREDLVRSRITSSTLWANPAIGYQREQILGNREMAEDTLAISQRLTMLGRRALRGEAGEQRVRAARLDNEMQRILIARDAKQRFYDLVYRQERVRAIEHLVAKLGEALTVVGHREKAGEASAYERRRLEREQRVAMTRLAAETIEREAAWHELLRVSPGLSSNEEWPRVSGALLPKDRPTATRGKRPDERALEARVSAAQLEADAAGRGWIPDLGLTAGWRSISDAAGRDHGFIAGALLGIPIFDHDQARAERAGAQQARADSEAALLDVDIARSIEKLQRRAQRFYEVAAKFRREGLASAEELSRVAELAYKGGELGWLELLDAHRSAVRDELLVVELERKARFARIELDAAMGVSP